MLSFLVQARAVPAAPRWTAEQIHDSVASITRQPAYAVPVRESIIGRIVMTAFRWIRDLIDRTGSWPDARYLLIAAVALLIVIIAARIAIDQRMNARRAAGEGLRMLGGDGRDYWALAAQLDAGGKHVEACHAIYLAVLDAFARAGLLRFHASKTSGDYARDLRQRAAPQAVDFAHFARAVERSVYGWTAPTHDDYAQLASAAERLVRRRAAA